jgi:thiol-disulfide isomerase/thioredoxin
MKRVFNILTILLCIQEAVHAQQKKLQVGDTLPPMVLSNLLNYPAKEIRLPDHSGKWLILDLWTTGCGACVEAFPKIKQLQNEFAGEVEWLMITMQSKEKITHFLQKRKILTGLGMSLPVVCGDSLLNNYFQPNGYPHCVWIDETGVIRSVTGGMEVTEEHVRSILRNKNFQMDQKDDSTVIINIDSPLYNYGNNASGKELKWSTTLSKYMHYIPWMEGFHISDSISSITAFNESIKRLYQIAFNDDTGYGDLYYLADSRLEFNIKDTTKYVFKINGEYQYENFYCYQAILPRKSVKELKLIMQADLKKYFGLNARMIKKNRLCWVLSAKDTMLFKSKGGKESSYWDGSNYEASFTNCSFNEVRSYFEHVLLQFSTFPLMNEISCNENVDMVLENIEVRNVNSLVTALRKYEISLKLEYRPIDVLVIDEPKNEN